MQRLLPTFLLTLFTSFLLNAQTVHLQADFNDTLMPAGWSSSITTGTTPWQIGIDAVTSPSGPFGTGIQSIDGTPLAFFDDDVLGLSSQDSYVSLITDTFDNSSNQFSILEFDYNFKAFNGIADSFLVDVYDGSNWVTVFSRNSDDCGHYVQCSTFPRANIDISAYKNSNCQVRFRYFDDNDWAWYVGLDNVEVWSPFPNDLSVDRIAPFSNICTSSDSLTITITNRGSNLQSNFPIRFILNNGSPVSTTYTGSLAFQDTAIVIFPTLVNYNFGSNQLSVFTDLTSDQERDNDTLKSNQLMPQNFNLPYQEDFEGSNQDWMTSGTNSSWQIGAPNGSLINSAVSGSNAAVTNLGGNYNVNETSYLTSPCISLDTVTTVRISFDLFYRTESSFDNAWLEYSTDGGNTYAKVLDNANYSSSNWYTNTVGRYWDGNSNGWLPVSVVMDNLPINTSLKFRFVFDSDGSTQLEGIGVDNFVVHELATTDLAVNQILYPGNNTICGLNTESIIAELENFGTDSISAAYLYYQVNGGTIFADSIQQTLSPGTSLSFIFGQSFNFSNLSTVNIKVWATTVGDSLNLNDTARIQIINTSGNNLTTPYAQDFDSMTVGGSPNQGWTRNPTTAFTSWTISNSGTPSLNTGPAQDATGGNFVFLETSTTYSQDPTFESPCIQLSLNPNLKLSYAYHMYGGTMGNLYVDIYDGSQWVQIDSIFGQQQSSTSEPWKYSMVPLSQYLGRSIKLRFRGRETPTNGFQSDMAIDDIKIDTVGVVPINIYDPIADKANCALTANTSVSMMVYNKTNHQLYNDSISFDLFLNGNLISTESAFTSNVLLPQNFQFFFQNNPSAFLIGNNQIKVRMNLIFNGKLIRDSLLIDQITKVNQLPYNQSFENMFDQCHNGNNWPIFDQTEGWATTSNRRSTWFITDSTQCSWSGSLTYQANTGPSVTYDGPSFIYWDNDSASNTFLYTPCFDLSNYNQATLEYGLNRFDNTFRTIGILKLELRHNGQWIVIDRDTTTTARPQIWITRSVDISQYLDTNMAFRFRLDSASNRAHTSIDGFTIFDPLVTNIKSLNTHTPTLAVYPNPNHGQFTIEIPEDLIGEQYQILDLSGKLVRQARFGQVKENLSLDLEKGVYFLRVLSPDQKVQKLVIY